ncbi:MAG: hypothetical protein GY950_12960, partial [bacterium]|nr:hypothetical protein [bacterium]
MNILRRIWIKIRLFWNPTNVVIRGSCKICGTCCRRLILTDGEQIVQSEEAFETLKNQYPQYEIFKFKSINNDADWVF